MKMTKNLDGSYSFSFTPKDFFSDTGIETIGVLAKAKDATGDKKSQDFIFQVGLFEVNLISPSGFTSVIESGENLEVEATSSSNSNFKLKSSLFFNKHHLCPLTGCRWNTLFLSAWL